MKAKNPCWNLGPKCRTIYFAPSGFGPWNIQTCWYASPKNQRAKRQTVKILLSLWRPLITLELTFNDVHIRKMKCLVVLAYGLSFQKSFWKLVVAINNVTQFSTRFGSKSRCTSVAVGDEEVNFMKLDIKVKLGKISSLNLISRRFLFQPQKIINFSIIIYITQATGK